MNQSHDSGAWILEDGDYSVRVSRVWARNGERLRIERLDGSVRADLDAIELETLTVEGLDLSQLLNGEG